MTEYLKSNDNINIDVYPYTYVQLREDHPNKSYPKDVATAMGLESNVYPVTILTQPTYDNTIEYLVRDTTPTKNGANWELGWTVTPYDASNLRLMKYNPKQFRIDLLDNANFDTWSDQLTGKEYTQLVQIASQENWTRLQSFWNTLKGTYTTGLQLVEWQTIADNNGIPNVTGDYSNAFTF